MILSSILQAHAHVDIFILKLSLKIINELIAITRFLHGHIKPQMRLMWKNQEAQLTLWALIVQEGAGYHVINLVLE